MIKLNGLDIEKDFLRLTLEDGSILIKDRDFRLDNYIISKRDMTISREVMDQYKEVMNEYDRVLELA